VARANITAWQKDFIPLGDVAARVAMIDIRCGRCERHGRLSVARLMAEWGPEACVWRRAARRGGQDWPKAIAERREAVLTAASTARTWARSELRPIKSAAGAAQPYSIRMR